MAKYQYFDLVQCGTPGWAAGLRPSWLVGSSWVRLLSQLNSTSFFFFLLVCPHWTGSLIISQTRGTYCLLRTLAKALAHAWSLSPAVSQFIAVYPSLPCLSRPC